MERGGLFYIIFLLTIGFLPNSLAQEYTQWHLSEGAIARLGKGKINDVEFSPDGKTVVTGTQQALIVLWDVDTRTVSHQIRTGDAARPTAFAFTQDGKTLVSGNSDGTIFIWDLEHITGR